MTNKAKTKINKAALERVIKFVTQSGKYGDVKRVLDLVPKYDSTKILQEYMLLKNEADFDIEEFVDRNFDLPTRLSISDSAANREKILIHIEKLWDELTVHNKSKTGSLLGLPHKYIVPGGRFQEQFYWDSYFIMLGLAHQDRWDLIESMIKNFAYMIKKYGFIPSANRDYFLTRSQPPFFCLMVELLATKKGNGVYKTYLKHMRKEYEFWMNGASKKLKKSEHNAFARIVQMPDGELLNRYYDHKQTPRPESIHKDEELTDHAINRDPERLYLHVRAAAESGWDFSSRWFTDGKNMKTIRTADMVPVDLNSLMYKLEVTLAKSYKLAGKKKISAKFTDRSKSRKEAIGKYCWSDEYKYFSDYDFYTNIQTSRLSLAGVFPMFVGAASEEQAELVAKKIETDFLKPGGLVTTLSDTGQQWDSPNGWAPLNWTAVQGFRDYGHKELADKIMKRWMETVESIYRNEGRLVEKYDVVNKGIGSGGEYVTQEGFGWTNGVYVDFCNMRGVNQKDSH